MSKQKKPWYKRCPADWQHGTRSCGMSMELRGFYSECLDAMWDLQGPLPKDGKRLAMLLGCNPRTVAKLMPKLVALGKMIETPTGYYNQRMLDDIGVTGAEAGFDADSKPIQTEFDAKVPKKPANTTREEESESESYTHTSARGVEFEDGRVSIGPDAAAALAADFPGVDLATVADLAAPELCRYRAPSPADRMAVVRKWARLTANRNREAAQRRPTASRSAAGADPNPTKTRLLAMIAAREAADATAEVGHG